MVTAMESTVENRDTRVGSAYQCAQIPGMVDEAVYAKDRMIYMGMEVSMETEALCLKLLWERNTIRSILQRPSTPHRNVENDPEIALRVAASRKRKAPSPKEPVTKKRRIRGVAKSLENAEKQDGSDTNGEPSRQFRRRNPEERRQSIARRKSMEKRNTVLAKKAPSKKSRGRIKFLILVST